MVTLCNNKPSQAFADLFEGKKFPNIPKHIYIYDPIHTYACIM